MANAHSVFSQILQWVPKREFQDCVEQHNGDKGVRKLPCWAQFVALLFGQCTGHNSLRAIEAGLGSVKKKLYHLGIAYEICRSTLSDANDKRSAKIYEEVFYRLLPRVERMAPRNRLRLKGKFLALDSTTIELCLALSEWAQFHHGKGAIKLHVALDLAGNLPTVIVVTEGRRHDVTAVRRMSFAAGTLLIMDRAYVDYGWLWKLTQDGVWFVTRMKKNCRHKVRECRKTNRTQGVMADQTIRLSGIKGRVYEGKLRKVSYRDQKTGQRYTFLTNRFDLAAKTICDIYKARWQVELFFKTMKQYLQVKKFLGTSVNAVTTQMWIALIAYLLLTMIRFQCKLSWSMPSIMAGLTMVLFANKELMDIWDCTPKERCVNIGMEQLSLLPI